MHVAGGNLDVGERTGPALRVYFTGLEKVSGTYKLLRFGPLSVPSCSAHCVEIDRAGSFSGRGLKIV